MQIIKFYDRAEGDAKVLLKRPVHFLPNKGDTIYIADSLDNHHEYRVVEMVHDFTAFTPEPEIQVFLSHIRKV